MKQSNIKLTSFFVKTTALFITIIVLMLTILNYPALSIENKEFLLQTQDQTLDQVRESEQCGTTQDNFELISEYEKSNYSDEEQITVGYSKESIANYCYTVDGIVTTVYETDAKIQFEIELVDDVGALDVYAVSQSGASEHSSVYFFHYDSEIFLSDISKDHAFQNCMKAKYESGEMTKNEWEDAWSVFSRRAFLENDDVNDNENNDNSPNELRYIVPDPDITTVSGYLKWKPSANSTTLPLRRSKIQLMRQMPTDDIVLGSSYTDDSGYYEFIFDNDYWNGLANGGINVYLRIYPESTSFSFINTVVLLMDCLCDMNIGTSILLDNPDWLISNLILHNILDSCLLETLYLNTQIANSVTGGTLTVFNKTINYDESMYINKCFYIQQGLVVGQKFALEMGMSFNKHIYVLFTDLYLAHDQAFCFGQNNLFVSLMYIGKDYFSDFDTIIHEYGHYVEHSMSTYGSNLTDIIIPSNSSHYSTDDNIHLKQNKSFALTLTWTESWATVFMFLAQKYYNADYSGVSYFGDIVNHNEGYNYSNIPTDNNNACEAQERAVISFLWRLYDSILSDNYQSWWNYTTANCVDGTHKIYTLNDFVHTIDVQHPNLRSTVGQYLSAHHLAPYNLAVTNLSSVSPSTPPVLSWQIGGSMYNPFDCFRVVFYSKYNEYICATGYYDTNSAAYNSTFQFTIPLVIWEQIINRYGGEFEIQISVQGYHTQTPGTGPYFTTYLPIYVFSNKTLTADSQTKYKELIFSLDEGEYCDIYITFATAGPKLFQTFGTKDTMISLYSIGGTLLASNDDSGYMNNGLIRYDCAANTTYKVRVNFFSTTVHGKLKFTVIPTKWTAKYGYTDIDNYSNIRDISSAPITLSTNAIPNNSKVFVFIPPESREYSFEITSNFDTFLYLIDPRSTDPIVNNVNYNDNGGVGANAYLTVTLNAYVQYLVIYSAANPGTLTETQSMFVMIKKV